MNGIIVCQLKKPSSSKFKDFERGKKEHEPQLKKNSLKVIKALVFYSCHKNRKVIKRIQKTTIY